MYELINDGTSRLYVIPDFTPDLYNTFKDTPTTNNKKIFIHGRTCLMRRGIGFFSDESGGYAYSGQITDVQSLTPDMRDLLISVNKALDTAFNGILINRYADGQDYISAHSDNERGLDKRRKCVACIAYGPGIRKFRIRHKEDNHIVLDHLHQPCSLLVMDGDFQSQYKHEIPVEKKVKGERISLTFRSHSE